MGLLRRNLYSFLFPGHPYGHKPDGTRESVASFRRKDAQSFWKLQGARPWVLSVAGDFDREEVLRFALSLPEPKAGAVSPPEPVWAPERELTLDLPGRNQAAGLMLFPTVPVDDADSPALELLAAALDGFSGQLFQELRERESLGYSVAPVHWAGDQAGFLAFFIVAAPENLPRARQGFQRIALRLGEELLPEAALDRARAVLEADYYTSVQSRDFRAVRAARLALRNRPMDHSLRRLAEMDRLTPEDIRAVARKYLDPDAAYSLLVTP
jgi:zinc protease